MTCISVHEFDPVADDRARVLILSTLPGTRSLEVKEYYADPKNFFWFVMGKLFNAGIELPYVQMQQQLLISNVALWDVLESAERVGSKESSIKAGTEKANDFNGFFGQHPNVISVFFNGRHASNLFSEFVLPDLQKELSLSPLMVLQSTSGATHI